MTDRRDSLSLTLTGMLWLGFFGLILWAWWVMYSMSISMGMMETTGGMEPMGEMQAMEEMAPKAETDALGEMTPEAEMAPMDGMAPMGEMGMPMGTPAYGTLFVMWAIMMAAMMGPTFVPTLSTYEDLITSANGTRGGSFGLVAGYFLAWVIFAAVIAAVQVTLARFGVTNDMGRSLSSVFSAGLLMAAGAYQFTSLKDRCLKHCRSPMTQFLAHWRPGFVGGIEMGAHHGIYCVACCWGLMAIGFVGGVMDLIWMGGATVLMTLEKIERVGRWLTIPIGVGLLGWGAFIAVTAIW